MKTLLVLALTLVSLKALAQEKAETQKIETARVGPIIPLFVIDGIPSSQAQLNLINPANIAKMEVMQKEVAVLLFGDPGKNGAVVVTTKKFQRPKPNNRQ